jgi:hypothetical protein
MALPDFIDLTQGTPIIWGESGASGVTNTLGVDALAQSSHGGAVVYGPATIRFRFVALIWYRKPFPRRNRR